VVSPNNILIPAPAGDSCPYGAPSPVEGDWELPTAKNPRQDIAVIDSGWQWDAQNWTRNPLIGHATAHAAERLPTSREATEAGPHWQPGVGEAPGARDPKLNRLLALAGHANFIAGVIAGHCREARIA